MEYSTKTQLSASLGSCATGRNIIRKKSSPIFKFFIVLTNYYYTDEDEEKETLCLKFIDGCYEYRPGGNAVILIRLLRQLGMIFTNSVVVSSAFSGKKTVKLEIQKM